MLPPDIVRHVFSFLPLVDHFNLAICNKLLYILGGLQSPLVAPWSKNVTISNTRIKYFERLCAIIRPHTLTIGQDVNYEISLCDLQNYALRYICNLPLKKLVLHQCYRITRKGFSYVKGLINLQHLDVKNSSACNISLQYLQQLKYVRYLDLEGTKVTDAGLFFLQGFPLTYLSLNNCRIDGSGLVHITHKLEHLCIRRCKLDDSILPILHTFKCLQHINLSSNSDITTLWFLAGMDVSCLYLSELAITNSELKHTHDLPLTHLDISWCENITNKGVQYIGDLSLERLSLRGCTYLTDMCLPAIGKIQSLSKLDIGMCNNFTPKGITKYIRRDVELDHTWCKQFEDSD